MNADHVRLVAEVDALLETQGRLMFSRENYNDAEAEQFGVRLLDFMRLHGEKVRAALAEALAAPKGGAVRFQQRVAPWMQACFGAAVAEDVRERGDRLLEEVLELLQSHGYDAGRVTTLRDYVFNRPVGEPAQEVGGVMVTLAAYCLATGLDMHQAGDTELARVWTQIDAIRLKQAAKRDIHSPLPGLADDTTDGGGA